MASGDDPNRHDSDDKGELSRRGFLKDAATFAVVVAAGGCRSNEGAEAAPRDKRAVKQRAVKKRAAAKRSSSRVVLVRRQDVLDDRSRPRARVIDAMLDQGVRALTGARTTEAAWKQLLKPGDRLGIKSNIWTHLATPPALERALKQRARKVGIPADRILIDDRGARTTLKDCTALINARPLRSHHWAGVGGCLKNYIVFVDKPWTYHPDACADLGALWKLPIVAGKTRLNVLVMLTPLFHGRGPHHFNPKYLWPYGGLILSRDPVAADAVGLAILEAKRREAFGGSRPFTTAAKHVALADTRHKVGVADLKRIELIKLGSKRGILI